VKHPLRIIAVCSAAAALLLGFGTAAPALATAPAAARTGPPAVLHVSQIARQNVASRGGCEPDTLVEPDVAVSPFNSNIQIAVAHDCRFATGGAVDIAYAWTHDGGAHWHNAAVPGLTRAVGGVWARASDPVVAFGPDGSVYISSLVFDLTCPGGIAVSRSVNGGATFGKPVLAHVSNVCTFSDDKNWLVVDTQPQSPFYGRIYQFWTAFLSTKSGLPIGSPQAVRWSDDQGRTWSATSFLGPRNENDQNSQPVIQPDGTIIDTYMFFGNQSAGEGPNGHTQRIVREHGHSIRVAAGSGVRLVTRTSRDGGATWSARSVVAHNIGGGPADIRCCLPLTTGDPATGRLFTVWNANGPGTRDAVELSSSADGQHWSPPVQVTHGNSATVQYINAAVAAGHGRVFVSYGARNTARNGGNIIQQELTWSSNGGASFGPPVALGPPSNLRFAAVAGARFPGDYTGLSLTSSRLTAVWCVSSRPPNPTAAFHQVLYAAVLNP
jgi:hypothetical protein